MKKLLFSFIFTVSILLTAQIQAPFYQSFDREFNFWSFNSENRYVPGKDFLQFSLERWAPRHQSDYFKNYWYYTKDGQLIGNPNQSIVKQDLKPQERINWNEPKRHEFVRISGRKGKSLKLTTLDNFDNAGGINDTIRSRTEIKIKPEHGENSEFYYSWSFMIPENEEHPDDVVQDNIIAQWHEPINIKWNVKNEQPPFFLIYKNDVHAKNNQRELGIMYGLRYDQNLVKHHSFRSNVNIEKGKWNEVVLHIKWSSDPKIGFLEIWINGEKVVNDGISKFYAANLYTDINGFSHPNFLKLGQYRLGQTTTQSIYLDEFRIGKSYEEVSLDLKFNNCESPKTVRKKEKIWTQEPIGINTYQFLFVDEQKVITSRKPYLKWPNKKWAKQNKEYEVKVRPGIYSKNNLSDGFGDSCVFQFKK